MEPWLISGKSARQVAAELDVNVLDEIIGLKTGPTQTRWKSAARDQAFDLMRDRVLIETQAEHLLAVLRAGTVSTNAFLRKVHNFAVDPYKFFELDIDWLRI